MLRLEQDIVVPFESFLFVLVMLIVAWTAFVAACVRYFTRPTAINLRLEVTVPVGKTATATTEPEIEEGDEWKYGN